MSHFPTETWSNIFRQLWEERFFYSHHIHAHDSDILHLILTCRRLYNTGIPHLYRHCPSLGDDNLTKILLSTLASNKLAASSVRVLTAECVLNSGNQDKDEVLESTGALLSTALEHLPNLTDLQLYFYEHTGRYENFEFSSEDLEKSELVAQQILSSPARFPFKLKSFATDLTCAPTVHAFLNAQPVQSIHWKYVREYRSEDSDEVDPLVTPKSLAISFGEDFELTLELLPSYFTLFPSVEHLVIHFRVFGLESEYSPDGIEDALGRLRSLHIIGDYDKGVNEMLTGFAPCLTSLESLYITAEDLDITRSECMESLDEVTNLIPSLKMVVFDHDLDEEDMEYWLQFVKHPDNLTYYAYLSSDTNPYTSIKPIEVYKDSTDSTWKYCALPISAFPVMPGSGINYDEHYRGNAERVLNIADWSP